MLTLNALRHKLGVWRIFRIVTISLVLIAAALFVYTERDFDSLWPQEETFGRIYADSPEIYTRERLVNDRYVQDGFLKVELKKLDDWTPKPQATILHQQIKQLGSDSKEVDWGKLASLAGTESLALPPTDEFRIRNAARELIRQELIENQLDDRHDLAGNTMFMLKIDASVIPGTNTTASAIIEARVELPEDFKIPKAQEVIAKVQSDDPSIQALDKLFTDWLDNFNRRVNDRAERIYLRLMSPQNVGDENAKFEDFKAGVEIDKSSMVMWGQGLPAQVSDVVMRDEDYAAIYATHSALEDITGEKINRAFKMSDTGKGIAFAFDEMSSLRVTVTPSGSRIRSPKIIAQPISNVISFARQECVSEIQKKITVLQKNPNWVGVAQTWQMGFLGRYESESETYLYGSDDLLASSLDTDFTRQAMEQVLSEKFTAASEDFWEIAKGKLYYSRADLATITDQEKRNYWDELIKLFSDGSGDCKIYSFSLLTGKIRFIKKLLESSSFTYAVLPKYDADIDVIGSDSLRQLDLSKILAAQPKDSPIELPMLEMAMRDQGRQMQSRSRLIGYGAESSGNGGGEGTSASFGWVIIPGRDLESGSRKLRFSPFQKSLASLVSVPVWWPSIRVMVKTGWIGSGGGEPDWTCLESAGGSAPNNGTGCKNEVSHRVRLPTDWQSIDDLVLREENRSPLIDRLTVPEFVKLNYCRSAAIEIPGLRLWRSTLVTLGGQQADKITVFPNMRGILAEFSKITVTETFPKLLVWTSEGVDDYPGKIELTGVSETTIAACK